MAQEHLTSTDRLAPAVRTEGPVPSILDWLEDGWATPSFWLRVVKRSMDIALSLLAVLVVLPFLAITAIAIMIESPGSPFFVQRRVGRYGTPFALIKLRTMVPRAEERLREYLAQDEALGEEWRRVRKLREDPRVTRVGRFLRRFSLDEVPQLLNVVCGQMSLVGPRPVPAHEGRLFGASWPLVLSVRPGLTGPVGGERPVGPVLPRARRPGGELRPRLQRGSRSADHGPHDPVGARGAGLLLDIDVANLRCAARVRRERRG